MLGLADWLQARVALIVATVQTIPRAHANPGEMSYTTADAARQQALAHIDVYRRWARTHPNIALVASGRDLEDVLARWATNAPRIGFVLLMENAEPVREPGELEFWVEHGIRLVGPIWHANRYGGNTEDGGPLTDLGRQLLRAMSRLDVALDLTHMSEEACLEALDSYEGRIIASHAHARRTVDKPRLLSDRVVEGIVSRDGIVGVLPLNWAVDASWRRGDSKDSVTIDAVVNAIDGVCEIAGDAAHVAIGSDFDGGQGAESAPAELDTVADLPKLASALARRGFSDEDVAAVMGGNWLRFFRHHLP